MKNKEKMNRNSTDIKIVLAVAAIIASAIFAPTSYVLIQKTVIIKGEQ